MNFLSIDVPESIKHIPHSDESIELIDLAHERLESFMLADDSVIENFVNCDFHLVDQALTWIRQSHLLAGNRFCELGSGFGVAAMLASLHGMESIGIEIEQRLVDASIKLADDSGLKTDFFCGSFVPRNIPGLSELVADLKHVDTGEGNVYREIGLDLIDFDLFFAFPWPGENEFYEAIVDLCAADGALLLTYCGREGMKLIRKK